MAETVGHWKALPRAETVRPPLNYRRILIDGKPVLFTAGEIHYFRLARKDWEDRVETSSH